MAETIKCFGCPTQIAAIAGNYYCDECVAKQTREQAAERQAFDDYHRFADAVARGKGTEHGQ